MALLLVESFDRYASFNGTLPKVTDRWTNSGTATQHNLVAGRFGGQCYRIWNAVSAVRTRIDLGANYTTICFGCAIYITEYGGVTSSAAYFPFFRLSDSAAASQTEFGIDQEGNLVAVRGSTIIASGDRKKKVKAASWHYLEFKALVSDTVGTVEMWIDGTKVGDFTNLDTKQTANTNYRWFEFAPSSALSNTIYFDDLYVTNGNRLGDLRILDLLPTADTADKDFVPNSGVTNYTQVDEVISDLDTTFNQGSVVGDLDFFTMQDVPAAMDSIVALCPQVLARKTDATARTLRPLLKSNTDLANGSNLTLATTHSYAHTIFETDPQGGGAWTAARVNAAQVGVEVTT